MKPTTYAACDPVKIKMMSTESKAGTLLFNGEPPKTFEMVRTGYGSLLFGPGIPDQRFFIKNLNLSQVIELDFMVILMVLICFNDIFLGFYSD